MAARSDTALAELRSLWQLPATWRLLRLLSRPLSFSHPSPRALEEALLNPGNHVQELANFHGRLLGLSAGKSADAKWIITTANFIRSFPGTFGHILGFLDPEPRFATDQRGPTCPDPDRMDKSTPSHPCEKSPTATSPGTSSADEDGRGLDLIPKTFSSVHDYLSLLPKTRLLVLHAIGEMVICEHDTLLRAGSISDVDVSDLRLSTLGVDALGSTYHYFGDESRIYREPSQRASRTREKRKLEEAAAAERCARVEEEQIRKTERLKREAQKKQRRMSNAERWAPRVSAGRSTRASLAKERELVGDVEAPSPGKRRRPRRGIPADYEAPNGDVHYGIVFENGSRSELSGSNMVQKTVRNHLFDTEDIDIESSHTCDRDADPDCVAGVLNGRREGSRRTSKQKTVSNTPERRSARSARKVTAAKQDSSYNENKAPTTRTSGRKRQPPPAMPVLVTSAQDAPVSGGRKRQRENSESRICKDPSLRVCEQWELVSSGGEELRAFIARFGPRKYIKHAAENSLLRCLEEECLPIIEEADSRLQREEEKRQRAEWLANNMKKSSRVSALEQKREREEALAQERAALEAEKEASRLQREQQVNKEVERLEKDITRELRQMRRRLERDRKGVVQEDVTNKPAAGLLSRNDRASRRGFGRSGTDVDNAPDYVAEAVVTELVNAAISRSTVCIGDFMLLENRVDEEGTDKTGAGELVKVEENGDADKERNEGYAPYAANATSNKPHQHVPRHFPSATAEEQVPEDLTWIVVADDGLPTRSLTQFVFLFEQDMSLAKLETVDDSESEEDRRSVFGYGVLVPAPDSDGRPLAVELGQVTEWVIEYGMEPRLWVKTAIAWYELHTPLPDYSKCFATALRKYEVCARLRILSQSMRAEQLSYENVLNLLSCRYLEMRSYKEADVLEEAPFIIEQMDLLGRASILKSAFYRQLVKNQRDAERKVEKERQRVLREEERVRQQQARAKQREIEKARQAVERAGVAAAKAREAELRRLRRQASISARKASSPIRPSVPAAAYPNRLSEGGLMRSPGKSTSQPVGKVVELVQTEGSAVLDPVHVPKAAMMPRCFDYAQPVSGPVTDPAHVPAQGDAKDVDGAQSHTGLTRIHTGSMPPSPTVSAGCVQAIPAHDGSAATPSAKRTLAHTPTQAKSLACASDKSAKRSPSTSADVTAGKSVPLQHRKLSRPAQATRGSKPGAPRESSLFATIAPRPLASALAPAVSAQPLGPTGAAGWAADGAAVSRCNSHATVTGVSTTPLPPDACSAAVTFSSASSGALMHGAAGESAGGKSFPLSSSQSGELLPTDIQRVRGQNMLVTQEVSPGSPALRVIHSSVPVASGAPARIAQGPHPGTTAHGAVIQIPSVPAAPMPPSHMRITPTGNLSASPQVMAKSTKQKPGVSSKRAMRSGQAPPRAALRKPAMPQTGPSQTAKSQLTRSKLVANGSGSLVSDESVPTAGASVLPQTSQDRPDPVVKSDQLNVASEYIAVAPEGTLGSSTFARLAQAIPPVSADHVPASSGCAVAELKLSEPAAVAPVVPVAGRQTLATSMSTSFVPREPVRPALVAIPQTPSSLTTACGMPVPVKDTPNPSPNARKLLNPVSDKPVSVTRGATVSARGQTVDTGQERAACTRTSLDPPGPERSASASAPHISALQVHPVRVLSASRSELLVQPAGLHTAGTSAKDLSASSTEVASKAVAAIDPAHDKPEAPATSDAGASQPTCTGSGPTGTLAPLSTPASVDPTKQGTPTTTGTPGPSGEAPAQSSVGAWVHHVARSIEKGDFLSTAALPKSDPTVMPGGCPSITQSASWPEKLPCETREDPIANSTVSCKPSQVKPEVAVHMNGYSSATERMKANRNTLVVNADVKEESMVVATPIPQQVETDKKEIGVLGLTSVDQEGRDDGDAGCGDVEGSASASNGTLAG